MSAHKWTEADVPDQSGRIAIVTGSNTGLGFDTARVLAQRGAKGGDGRPRHRQGRRGGRADRAATPAADVTVHRLDLGSLDSVRAAGAELAGAYPRIDLLINNAGVMYPPNRPPRTGSELQFGTNHLGHFALTGLLLNNLLPVDGSRVVVVASIAHTIGPRSTSTTCSGSGGATNGSPPTASRSSRT